MRPGFLAGYAFFLLEIHVLPPRPDSNFQSGGIYWTYLKIDAKLRAAEEIGPWNSKMALALLAQAISMWNSPPVPPLDCLWAYQISMSAECLHPAHPHGRKHSSPPVLVPIAAHLQMSGCPRSSPPSTSMAHQLHSLIHFSINAFWTKRSWGVSGVAQGRYFSPTA